MNITRRIEPYIIDQSASIAVAMKKLEDTALQILFVVSSARQVIGVLTDGDLRRWMLRTENLSLEHEVADACNRDFSFLPSEQANHDYRKKLDPKIRCLPVLDSNQVIVGVVKPRDDSFYIGDQKVGGGAPCYIIAEVGNNHQGSLDTAKRLVDLSAEAGVDCVKFQMRSMEDLYGADRHQKVHSLDLGAQYTADLLEQYQLDDDELFEVFEYCIDNGVQPLCTPWDVSSFHKLNEFGLPAFKVASADFTNHFLLKHMLRARKPLICSTGMTSEEELLETADLLKSHGAECVLLHCNSTYPTPFKDVNLRYMKSLQNLGFPVGYSGHERGTLVPVAAVAMGAVVVEKHITLDREQMGTDHKVSLLPKEFKEMVSQIKVLEDALGTEGRRSITQGELINRDVLAKSLFSARDIEVGELITREDIVVRSPGNGLQPNRIDQLVGIVAQRKISKGVGFLESDITPVPKRKPRYKFQRPYGIPVRYHDFSQLTQQGHLDFVEFHLSYKDLSVDPSQFIPVQEHLRFAVHAPELFENDHILDLCSTDDRYCAESIRNFQRVLTHCDALKALFPATSTPILVLNAGGWHRDGFLDEDGVAEKYRNLKHSLSLIDHSSVDLAIQTMPPFPWHFGGQSHHNVFVAPDQISGFCEETGVGVCLDISHTIMACNYYGWALPDFITKIGPHIRYLHVADGLGADGEGVQIGRGDVDFEELSISLKKRCPDAPFIPEIWQGHKDMGRGFWQALSFLESKL